MTVKEAASYIGASEYKLREMVRMKQIPAYKVGSRIYFRKDTIDEWIAQQERENCEQFTAEK
ncbi:helix-turn-helix domain-containing protein [Brevibacillus parabrevis]|uniref:helix-turn-helix domain-containing protein n=1 Tax=Brevibacillus parabrevis TaxID=54914 RepID=UPI0023809479|nr:helix-turn-helix domain-containing protein [Brevibacillus parabrevis]WDV98245.1 helix-turn-helix domain-containing protein [Brevibacillus parabrevis]